MLNDVHILAFEQVGRRQQRVQSDKIQAMTGPTSLRLRHATPCCQSQETKPWRASNWAHQVLAMILNDFGWFWHLLHTIVKFDGLHMGFINLNRMMISECSPYRDLCVLRSCKFTQVLPDYFRAGHATSKRQRHQQSMAGHMLDDGKALSILLKI